MKRLRLRALLVACALLLAACATDLAPPAPDRGERRNTVLVLSNGWHAEIVLPMAAIAATGLLPEAADFPDAAFLAFGWGDRVYYQAPATTLGITLSAALLPTPAVMHVTGYRHAPEPRGAEAEILSVALTDAGLKNLITAIADTFERPDGRATPGASGLGPGGRFYNATGTFHLFNTCNTWTARMLRAGGVEVSPAGIVTAENLMARLREIAPAYRSR